MLPLSVNCSGESYVWCSLQATAGSRAAAGSLPVSHALRLRLYFVAGIVPVVLTERTALPHAALCALSPAYLLGIYHVPGPL